jgi:molecular chaperone GrpE
MSGDGAEGMSPMFGARKDKDDARDSGEPARSERADEMHAPGNQGADRREPEPDVPDVAAYEDLLNDLAKTSLERDQAKADYLRALAEYQNYQRRALGNEAEARRQGVMSVLNSVLPVMDHFDMALNQRVDTEAAQRVVDGVKVIKAELVRALERHGVGVINPAMGDEPDHARHSVLMHRAADGVEPGRISGVMQLGDRVVRPAMVTVAPAGTNETGNVDSASQA